MNELATNAITTKLQIFTGSLRQSEDYAVFTTDREGNLSSWNTGSESCLVIQKKNLGVNCSIFFTETDRPFTVMSKRGPLHLSMERAVDERFMFEKTNLNSGHAPHVPLFDNINNM